MIAIDTNVLARFYVDDPSDPEAKRQRPLAAQCLRDTPHVFVSVTVVLELAWVLQAFYEFSVRDFCAVIAHLVGLPNVTVEHWESVIAACEHAKRGLDFADALHLARASGADALVTFDDKKFARRAQKIGTHPPVVTLKG